MLPGSRSLRPGRVLCHDGTALSVTDRCLCLPCVAWVCLRVGPKLLLAVVVSGQPYEGFGQDVCVAPRGVTLDWWSSRVELLGLVAQVNGAACQFREWMYCADVYSSC
jgi:hypothetical protein